MSVSLTDPPLFRRTTVFWPKTLRLRMRDWSPTTRLPAPTSMRVLLRPVPTRSIGDCDRRIGPGWVYEPTTWIVSRDWTMFATVIAWGRAHGSSWAQAVAPLPCWTYRSEA